MLPYDVDVNDSEEANQNAYFAVIRIAAEFGLSAAKTPEVWALKGLAKQLLDQYGKQISERNCNALRLAYAVPNGLTLKGGGFAGGKALANGLNPGIPDICVPVARGGFHALYIELKMSKGRVSPEQKKKHDLLTEAGNLVRLCVGWREAFSATLEYLGD